MSKKTDIPSLKALMDACFEALKQLGGSGTVREIDEKASKILKLTKTQLNIPHQSGKGSRTEFQYRMAWARTHLKKQGLIRNPKRSAWVSLKKDVPKTKSKTQTTSESKDLKKSPKDNRFIRQVKLQNFLSFGPDTPALQMENLNVIIGPNGSGKSNFIEAIEIMSSTPGDLQLALRNAGGAADLVWKGNKEEKASVELVLKVWDILIRHFVIISNFVGLYLEDEIIEKTGTKSNDSQPRVYFKHGEPKSLIGVTQNKKWTMREVEVSGLNSVLRQFKDPSSYMSIFRLGLKYERVRIYRDWTFGRDTIFRLPQQADMPSDHLEGDFSNLGMYLNRLRRNVPAKKAVLSGLRDLYEGIDDFDVKVEGGTVQVFFTEGNYIIPATRLSDGTLRYLCLMAILFDPDPPPLICIEEPELGLHPDILPTLAKHLISASERTQLIVTTHSDILVDAMTERPEVVVVCEKHNGQTEMNRLDKESLKIWLDKYRLGELWLDGEIGGTRW